MSKQFKTARLINNLKMTDAAEKLGVSQPTLSAWEGERKSPSIEKLESMAEALRRHDRFSSRQGRVIQPLSFTIDFIAIAIYFSR